MKQAASRPQATNGQMSWPKRERVMTPSNLSCTTRARQLSNQAEPSSATLLRAKRRSTMATRCRTTPGMGREGRVLTGCSAVEGNGAARRVASTQAMVQRGQNWHAQSAGNDAGESRQGPQCNLLTQTGSFVWCCRCGARAAKFVKKIGEPCVRHPRSQEYARSIRLPSSGWHPKEHRFSWIAEAVHSASMEEVAVKLPRGQLRQSSKRKQAVDRLLSGEAQPTDPADKKHLLLKTGEVKWCWRRGARAEMNSAPRVLLETACKGALRTEECERALTLLGKGQHPKNSVSTGRPTPICDEEWDQCHESHDGLFFLCSRAETP